MKGIRVTQKKPIDHIICESIRPCVICNVDFHTIWPMTKYCDDCRVGVRVESRRKSYQKYHARYLARAAEYRKTLDPAIENAKKKKYLQEHPGMAKSANLKKKHGVNYQFYLDLFAKQDGKCAICGQPEKYKRYGKVQALAVDHDHDCCSGPRACGKCIRGLLCRDCNVAIGLLKHDPQLFADSVAYIKRGVL